MPPVRYHTPSATIWVVTTAYGAVAVRTLSGTATSTGMFGRTSATVRSSVGNPPAVWRIFVGNFTPPKSL